MRRFSRHRRAGLEALFGMIDFQRISYELTRYIGGPATGGRSSIIDADRQNQIIRQYRTARGTRNHIAVVSCIVGAYDLLILPCHLLPDADYICFSDRPRHNWGVFEIRPMDFLHADATRSARFVKTHLHRYLREYETIIWLDANVIVLGDLRNYVDRFLMSGKAFGALPHPFRRTVYEEAEACKAELRDDAQIIDLQVTRYLCERFETDNLIETGFFICKPKDDRFRRFCDSWWREIDRYSRRDQLSINYALQYEGLEWLWLLEKGEDIRTHSDFRLSPHAQTEPPGGRLSSRYGKVIDPYQNSSYRRLKSKQVALQRNLPVDVVVCVHDAIEPVQQCLSSLVPTLGRTHRLIVIDDASNEPTAAFLRDTAAANNRMVLLRNEQRLGYTNAANIGLRASLANFVILLNSDTVVSRDWIEKLHAAALTRTDIGIVGPLSNAAGFQSVPNHLGPGNQTAFNELPAHLSIAELDRWCEKWTVGSILPRVPLVHGFCLGMKREVIERIGLLDEESFPDGYGEEDDFCFRATDAGFGLVVATHTYVFHAKSKSYSAEQRARLTTSGMAVLRAKHGEQRINRAIAAMVANPILQVFRENASKRYHSWAPGTVLASRLLR